MHFRLVWEVMCLAQGLERGEGMSRCMMVGQVVGDRHNGRGHSRQKVEHSRFGMRNRVDN